MIVIPVIVEMVISYIASFNTLTNFGAITWDKLILLENL